MDIAHDNHHAATLDVEGFAVASKKQLSGRRSLLGRSCQEEGSVSTEWYSMQALSPLELPLGTLFSLHRVSAMETLLFKVFPYSSRRRKDPRSVL